MKRKRLRPTPTSVWWARCSYLNDGMVKAIYLRHATLADLAALEVLEQTFPGDRLSRRSLRHLLTRANAAVLVAEQDTLLGDAVVLFRKGSSRARLYSLVVAPEARGRGLGARLLNEVETEARARGCTKLRLEVREDNVAATRLYERAGFQHIGRVDDYYEDHAGAVKMVKNL